MNGSTIAVGIGGLVVGGLIGMYALAPKDSAQDMDAPAGTTAEAPEEPAADAGPGPRVRWKMASAFPGEMVQLGDQGKLIEERLRVLLGGTMEFKFFEPGALVPALECFDAASKGSVEACWTTPGYHTGKLGAGVAFFTAVPFGPQIGEYLAWKWFGGGNDVRDEAYARHGVMAFDSQCIGPETSGWFREEIQSVDDLRGFKMRFFGVGAQVMQKLGVSTQLLAAADIYPALEKGVIDATEFSMPAMDINLGFYQIAKYNYYPGWHQQITCSEILINQAKFDALPDEYKAMVEIAAGHQIAYTYAETEARNPGAMNKMLSEYGVTNKRWSDEDLARFEAAWREVAVEVGEKDELWKKTAESYFAWREVYKTWGDAQSLDSTYLE